MQYLGAVTFPDRDREFDFFVRLKRRCYTDFYPFHVLSAAGLTRLSLEPVTILQGGNGSGKTTALNVMAGLLGAKRDSAYNRSWFFEDYLNFCEAEWVAEPPQECRIITSDDVFDYMLNIRSLNAGVDRRREEMFDEYQHRRSSGFQLRSLEDYEQLRLTNRARSQTQSRFVRENLAPNVQEYSNGESAFLYFTEKIGENGLYLLDEPENSLSAKRQRELVRFLEDSVRFFHCQFVISTHSPFLLAFPGAKIYDLDTNPACVRPWTQLENVRQYYDFFREHGKELEDGAK